MNRWRLLLAGLLTVLVGLPVLFPFVECFRLVDPSWLETNAEHLAHVTANTLLLVVGTLAISLPVGTFLAVLLFRTDFPGRRAWITGMVLVIFVPLPMLMSAWQAFLGRADGWLPLSDWDFNLDRKWLIGLLPSIWVHSLAGIPWVVLIVGNGLCWIERELEEDALLYAGPWRVLWRVTLPRCRGSLAAAALWLALSTFAEIGVTFFLQVPTLAEEVQTQFSSGSRAALARSVLMTLPMMLAITAGLLWVVPRLERSLPPLQGWLTAPRPFPLGAGRWPLAIMWIFIAAIVMLVPIGSLIWKVGLAGAPRTWSLHEAWVRLTIETRLTFTTMLLSCATAAVTALLTAVVGLTCCWLARDSRWFGGLLLLLLVLAWSLPGPVIGVGLKELILMLEVVPFDTLLYQGPSPLPIMWAHFIRFLPVAAALLWPWVRTVPKELLESARLEGAGPIQELVQVAGPSVARGFGWTTLIVTALCLGEVASSNRVETPGWQTFARLVLDRMHYGVDSTVAGLCLMLLAWLLAVLSVGAVCWRLLGSGERQ